MNDLDKAILAQLEAKTRPQPALPAADDAPRQDADDLRQKVEAMEQTIRQLQNELSVLRHPMREIFLAKVTGKQWQEQTVNKGTVEDFPDGRLCNSDGAAAALLTLNGDVRGLLQIRDVDADGNEVMRYAPFGGGSESIGTEEGQGHVMVTDNQGGWDFDKVTAQR